MAWCLEVRIYHYLEFFAAVEVSFEEVAYTVNEAAGSLSVCVEITGLLERNITVNISTANGEALGKYFLNVLQ